MRHKDVDPISVPISMAPTKQSRAKKQRPIIDCPWRFSDTVLEHTYDTEQRDLIYDRVRAPGQMLAIFAWVFNIPYFCYRALSAPSITIEELIPALFQKIILIFFTTVLFLNFGIDARKRAGRVFIWISRVVHLPLHMFNETGIPILITQLLIAQARAPESPAHYPSSF